MTAVPETTVGDVPEMVERVARAMVLDHGGDPDKVLSTYGGSAALWTFYVPAACAAIGAMREPTESMRFAAWYDQFVSAGNAPNDAEIFARRLATEKEQARRDVSSFSAAIDAALGNAEVAR